MTLPRPGTNDIYTAALWYPPMTSQVLTVPTAVTMDVSVGGPLYGVSQAGSGNVTSWTLTNPTNDQQITLVVGRTGVQTVVWPANILWNGGGPPNPPTAGQLSFVQLRYRSAEDRWHEMSRSAKSTEPKAAINLYPTPLDARHDFHYVFNTGGGNITLGTPTNPTDGQILQICYYRSAAQTLTWPSNFRFINNAAPAAPTANTRNFYTFRYQASTGLWYECAGRAESVPNT